MINEQYKKALIDIYDNGKTIFPRNFECKELLCYKFEIDSPNDNVITINNFKTNLNYAKEELNWYYSMSNKINYSKLINKIWSEYSDDGLIINSNYGERIFGKHKIIKNNQWEQVKNELKKDKDSRRAIININSYFDKENLNSKDIPCSLAIQSLIRDNKLDWIIYMRSNDINKGFRNDLYCFTEMQKKMADELNIEYGKYYHIAGSMHLYKEDYEKVLKLKEEIL